MCFVTKHTESTEREIKHTTVRPLLILRHLDVGWSRSISCFSLQECLGDFSLCPPPTLFPPLASVPVEHRTLCAEEKKHFVMVYLCALTAEMAYGCVPCPIGVLLLPLPREIAPVHTTGVRHELPFCQTSCIIQERAILLLPETVVGLRVTLNCSFQETNKELPVPLDNNSPTGLRATSAVGSSGALPPPDFTVKHPTSSLKQWSSQTRSAGGDCSSLVLIYCCWRSPTAGSCSSSVFEGRTDQTSAFSQHLESQRSRQTRITQRKGM